MRLGDLGKGRADFVEMKEKGKREGGEGGRLGDLGMGSADFVEMKGRGKKEERGEVKGRELVQRSGRRGGLELRRLLREKYCTLKLYFFAEERVVHASRFG